MRRTRSHARTRDRAAHILVMGAAGLLVFGGASYAALADSNPAQTSPAPSMEPRLEAPIGHRQPNAEDIPAGVLKSEGTTNRNQRDLDEKLNICRGC
jgi:hypothetical protein